MPYQILNWRESYENAESRKYKNCRFVCVPNNQDKEGVTRIIADPDGVSMYGIWCLILGAASKHPNRDGWLTSDGTPEGTPWTAEYLALRWRTSTELVQKTLDVLSSESVGWIALGESRKTLGDDGRSVGDDGRLVGGGGRRRETTGGQWDAKKGELELELEQEVEPPLGPPSGCDSFLPVDWKEAGQPERRIFLHWLLLSDRTEGSLKDQAIYTEQRIKLIKRRLKVRQEQDWHERMEGYKSTANQETLENYSGLNTYLKIDGMDDYIDKLRALKGKDEPSKWGLAAKELIALRESMEVKSKIGTASSDAQQICSRIGREKLEAMDMATVRSVVYQVADKLAGK